MTFLSLDFHICEMGMTEPLWESNEMSSAMVYNGWMLLSPFFPFFFSPFCLQLCMDNPLPFHKWNTWNMWYTFQDSLILKKDSKISSTGKVSQRLKLCFSSLHLSYFIPATIITSALLILCYNRMFMCLSPPGGL